MSSCSQEARDRSPRRLRGAGRLCGDGSGRSGRAGIWAGTNAGLRRRADPVITALEASTVMLLGGEPLGPRHIWWNFVSSRKDRIEQAKADWQSGRIHLPSTMTRNSSRCRRSRGLPPNRCPEPPVPARRISARSSPSSQEAVARMPGAARSRRCSSVNSTRFSPLQALTRGRVKTFQ